MPQTRRPALLVLALLSGCASLGPPSPEQLAALPVVHYPDKPAQTDYVYKLVAGKPIDVRVRAEGTALGAAVEQTVSATLGHDLYLYKTWASEDGRTWVRADRLIDVRLHLVLPSYETPGPGAMRLTVDRKTP